MMMLDYPDDQEGGNGETNWNGLEMAYCRSVTVAYVACDKCETKTLIAFNTNSKHIDETNIEETEISVLSSANNRKCTPEGLLQIFYYPNSHD